MATLNFDATQVQPNDGQLGAMPAGWYNVMIDQSEMKPTKGGEGAYLELRMNVLDGACQGRKLFSRLNLKNSNPVAQEIAYKDLSAIAHAVGVLQIQDSGQLHNIPLKVKVKVRAASSEYEASNDITAYKNINHVVDGAAAAAPAGNFQPQAQQPAFQPPAQQQQPAQQPWQQPQQQQAPQPQQPWQQPQAQQPWQQPQGQAPQQQAQPQQQQPQQQAPQQQAPAQQWNQAPQGGAQQATPPWQQAPQQ